MSGIQTVFGDFTSGEIAGATRALEWAAKEIADTNNFTKTQTEALQALVLSNKELQKFFTTAENNGFSALRDDKLNTLKTNIINDMKDPIAQIVKDENNKIWKIVSLIITGIISILGAIFWWIQNNAIDRLIETLK